MNTGGKDDNLLTIAVAYGQQWYVEAKVGLAQIFDSSVLSDVAEKAVQFFEAIGEAVCKLNASVFVVLKEV